MKTFPVRSLNLIGYRNQDLKEDLDSLSCGSRSEGPEAVFSLYGRSRINGHKGHHVVSVK